MPRKAPGPNNGVTEHRMTFGDFERKEFKQAIEAIEKSKETDQLLKYAPPVILAGGVAVAAYALWRWVGLGSLIDRVTDTYDSMVGGAKDTITFFTTGDIFATSTGSKIHDAMMKAANHLDDDYAERMQAYQTIIDDPNMPPNVKGQAEQDKIGLTAAYTKQKKRLYDRYAKVADKAGEVTRAKATFFMF